MRGQVALEFMIIVGVALSIITLFAAYSWTRNEIATRSNQADIAANAIASAADQLYAQGPGAKTKISIFLPIGYNSTKSSISNKVVRIAFSSPAGPGEAIASSKANLIGTLPSDTGYKILTLELIGGSVQIS